MLTLFQNNLSPSVSDTITVNGVAFDLTGSTVTFKMRLATSSTVKVSSPATIVSAPAGTVRYDWTGTDTDTPGMYVFWWSVTLPSGKVQDSPETDIEITQHATVASNALCTISDVHLAMELPVTDTSLDNVIAEYIDEVSELIIKMTRREFAPVSTATTRRFKVSPRGRIDLNPYDLQSATQVMLHPEQSMQIISSSDYQLAPLVSNEGVYTAMRISPWIPIVSLVYLKFGYALCDITGTWGFANVPEPVKRAAVIAVRTWCRKDAKAMAGSIGGQYYSGQELPAELPSTYALPAASRKLLIPYVRTIGAV